MRVLMTEREGNTDVLQSHDLGLRRHADFLLLITGWTG